MKNLNIASEPAIMKISTVICARIKKNVAEVILRTRKTNHD